MPSENSSASPHSHRSPMEEIRPSIPGSSSSELHSIITASPIPPHPRRSMSTPKKPASAEVSVPANNIQAGDGTYMSTSTSESVAQAISLSQLSGLPTATESTEPHPRKPVSTSESVARAISSNQPSVLSSKSSDNVGESVTHVISSGRSSALPASQRSSQVSQAQSDAATAVLSSTSENIARAISSNKSSVPTGQASNRPSIDSMPLLSAHTQTGPVVSHSAKPTQEAQPSRKNSILSSTSQVCFPNAPLQPTLPSKSLGGAGGSSAPAEQKPPLSTSPSRGLPFNSRTSVVDRLDKSTSSPANVPPVRSFSSSTLILNPRIASTSVSLTSSRDSSRPSAPAPKRPLMTASAGPLVTDQPRPSEPREAHESSSGVNHNHKPSAAITIDQVTDDIPPNTIASGEEERDYQF
jgi:hypothetical protein